MTEPIPAPDPGIYEGIPFDVYCQWDAVNNSSLGPFRRSAAHYKAALEAERKETDALKFGTFCHMGKLEPLAVLNSYVVMPAFEKEITREDGTPYDKPRATKQYTDKVAEFTRVNSDKEIVTKADYDNLIGISESLNKNARAKDWFGTDGPSEVSIVWDDPITGLRCKGRIDKLDWKVKRITDLKTTRDAQKYHFSLYDYGVARQAAFYRDGMFALTGDDYEFCVVAIEKEPPYGVRSAPISERTLYAGFLEYSSALKKIFYGRTEGNWPGYSDPDVWELPAKHLPDAQLTINGEKVNI